MNLKQLLSSRYALPDVYELVGRPRLDPQREALYADLHQVVKDLQTFHNHESAELRLRAIQWHRELCGLEAVVRDIDRFREHEAGVVAELTRKYAEGAGADARRWQSTGLERWLQVVQNIAPTRVAEVAREMVAAQSAKAPIASESSAIEMNVATPAAAPATGGRISWRDIATSAPAEAGLRYSTKTGVVRPEDSSAPTIQSSSRSVNAGTSSSHDNDSLPADLPLEPLPNAAQSPASGSAALPPLPSQRPEYALPPQPMSPEVAPSPTWAQPFVQASHSMSATERMAWIGGALLIGIIIPAGFGGWFLWTEHERRQLAINATDSPMAVSTATTTPPLAAKSTPSSPVVPSPAKSTPTPGSPLPSAAPTMTPVPVPKHSAPSATAAAPIPAMPTTTTPHAFASATATVPKPRATASATATPLPPRPTSPPGSFPTGYESPALLTQSSPVTAMAFSVDGRFATGDAVGTVRIWDATGTKVEHELPGAAGGITCLAFSDDGKWLAEGCDDGSIELIKIADRSRKRADLTRATLARITGLAWRYHQSKFLVGDDAGLVMLCTVDATDKVTVGQPREFPQHGGVRHIGRGKPPSGPGAKSHGDFVVTYSGGAVAIWNPDRATPDRVLLSTDHERWGEFEDAFAKSKGAVKNGPTAYVPLRLNRIFAASWNDLTDELALAGGDVESWEMMSQGAFRRRLLPGSTEELQGYLCCAWSSDGKFLAAGNGAGRILVWDIDSVGTKQYVGLALSRPVTHLAWSSGGANRLAVLCEDGIARIWTIQATRSPGPFRDIDKDIEVGSKFASDDESYALFRVTCVLRTQLPFMTTTQKLREEEFRDALKKAGEVRWKEVSSPPQKGQNAVGLVEGLTSLQDVLDWAPAKKVDALKFMEKNLPFASHAK